MAEQRPTALSYPIEANTVSGITITLFAVLIPLELLFIFKPFDTTGVFNLLLGNWISPIIVWFFCIAIWVLIGKKRLLKREQRANLNIYSAFQDNGFIIDDTLKGSLSNQYHSDSLLLRRIVDGGSHEQQAIKEKELQQASFAIPRFIVWAIPIIGFIGTVWGISGGISHFSEAMSSSNNISDVSSLLKDNLPLVTKSLATAFDTTLLALLLSIPVMLLITWQEKQEDTYLLAVQQMAANIDGGDEETSLDFSNFDTTKLATEIGQLGTKIDALQALMRDIQGQQIAQVIDKKNDQGQ